MLEEMDKEELSKKFFGSKQNIATVAIIAVENSKGENFETTFTMHKIAFCKLTSSDSHSTYLLANIHPSLCEYWFGPENLNLKNYVFGAMDTSNPPSVVFRYMVREEGQDTFRRSSISKDIEVYLNQNESENFDRAIDRISLGLESRYGWNPEYRSIIEKIALRENVTLSYLYRHAAANLLTREQEERRRESLERLAADCIAQESRHTRSRNSWLIRSRSTPLS